MRDCAKVAVLACIVVVMTSTCGCWLVAHDSERRPLEVDEFVMYWSVTDTSSGAELSRGCGLSSDRVKKIRFLAPVGSQVTETVLFEHAGKLAADVPIFADLKLEDAFWCSKEHDLFRVPYKFKQDLDCLRISAQSRAVKIISREVIEGGSAMGGYRFGLEITGTGPMMYETDRACPMSRGSELTVLDP